MYPQATIGSTLARKARHVALEEAHALHAVEMKRDSGPPSGAFWDAHCARLDHLREKYFNPYMKWLSADRKEDQETQDAKRASGCQEGMSCCSSKCSSLLCLLL